MCGIISSDTWTKFWEEVHGSLKGGRDGNTVISVATYWNCLLRSTTKKNKCWEVLHLLTREITSSVASPLPSGHVEGCHSVKRVPSTPSAQTTETWKGGERERRWHLEGVSCCHVQSSSSSRESNQENQRAQTFSLSPRLGTGDPPGWKVTRRGLLLEGWGTEGCATGGASDPHHFTWWRHVFSKQECSRKLQTAWRLGPWKQDGMGRQSGVSSWEKEMENITSRRWVQAHVQGAGPPGALWNTSKTFSLPTVFWKLDTQQNQGLLAT